VSDSDLRDWITLGSPTPDRVEGLFRDDAALDDFAGVGSTLPTYMIERAQAANFTCR
jgi:hypothetical protein